MRINILQRIALGTASLVLCLAIMPPPQASAAGVNYLTGQIVCTNGECYMIHRRHGDKFRRYIGTAEYLREWQRITHQPGAQTSSGLFEYTRWNWGVELPCGQIAQDTTSKDLVIVENLIDYSAPWHTGLGYNYSDASEFWLPAISNLTLQYIVTRPGAIKHYQHTDFTARRLAYGGNYYGGAAQIDAGSLPMCIIVKQTGTNDFYRITGNGTGTNNRINKKSYIGNNEILQLWLERNGYFIEADLTALPGDAPAEIPPGLLVRGLTDSTVYFVNDQGEKWKIGSLADFNTLGFSLSGVTYLNDATVNSMPTQGTWSP